MGKVISYMYEEQWLHLQPRPHLKGSQLEKVTERGYCRGHIMAHQALTVAEPSMGSLTPSSLFLYLPDLLATPPPPLSSFTCALLAHSLTEEHCVLAKSIWSGWGQTGSIWRVLLCDLGSDSCPLLWRVGGGLLAVLHTLFISLWEILSKHLIIFL